MLATPDWSTDKTEHRSLNERWTRIRGRLWPLQSPNGKMLMTVREPSWGWMGWPNRAFDSERSGTKVLVGWLLKVIGLFQHVGSMGRFLTSCRIGLA